MTQNLVLTETSNLENFPEEFEDQLKCQSLVICCSFNRLGTLLAVGCNDGFIYIWDFLTKTVAKSFLAHAGHPISSLSWSRNGQRLASASMDNSLAIWHVLSGDCIIRLTLNFPLQKIQINPRNDNLVIVNAVVSHPALLLVVDYKTKTVPCIKNLQLDKEDQEQVASFDRRGQYIYVGNQKGKLSILKVPTIPSDSQDIELETISSFRVHPSAIKEIEFGARNKTLFIVSSSDRCIRLYTCDSALKAGINGSCEEVKKFQDMVNKTVWKRCCISGDADASYVCGASGRQHAIYIWERENGTIKKMHQRGKGEMLLDFQWHPNSPIVVSLSNNSKDSTNTNNWNNLGVISIWAKAKIDKWSAYAPGFKELEENVEYEERESEFDIEDEDNPQNTSRDNIMDAEDEDIDVDVEEISPQDYLMSSDEECVDPETLMYIPFNLEGN